MCPYLFVATYWFVGWGWGAGKCVESHTAAQNFGGQRHLREQSSYGGADCAIDFDSPKYQQAALDEVMRTTSGGGMCLVLGKRGQGPEGCGGYERRTGVEGAR